MKIDAAKKFAEQLLAAIARAEAEGRDELKTGDIDMFAAADDAAREELEKAINAAENRATPGSLIGL